MHGRVQRGGESNRSLQRISSLHMQSALPLATTDKTVAVVGDLHSPLASTIKITTTGDSFFKDGRKISVGECALFKPSQDSPPFIGLIRWLTLSKGNNLQLGVSWLYRPAELKLAKGTLVDGAPNEIFYSFHKDETPAASLLHPCKVAFLPRGVELLNGTSSFVCRRVYDISNKRLWWLTDQDFIKEQQKEVDQLLNKTRTEMHATSQPDGRSPKQVNGPTSTLQLKHASDSGQNSGTFPSQVKGKKRERVDHGADPIKRERSLRSDDGELLQHKTESNLKSEIARITEKGAVVDLEGVEKLVQLMQTDRIDKKIDLVSRSMLAGVMAATDRVDCLNRFVQLRGLPVFDEWLQDIHKGKIGEGNSLKESDKSTEEFILVLLRALDKLPVNLHALQMCNIGRSVNHLRSHKNFEIQRKARSLVDTWKKRVEAEMNNIDTKTGSTRGVSAWHSKSRFPEASHGGSRTPSGSDVALKSSITHNSASKTTSSRSTHGESLIKSATSSPGPVKPVSSPASGQESQPTISIGGTPDVPLIREDRSSCSNQSHNYNKSSSGKEDGKSSTAGLVTVNRISNSSTRNRKTSCVTISVTGSQKEISSCRSSSVYKTTSLEKLSQSVISSERVLDETVTEGSSHKLIVKIPNRVHSPSQGVGDVSQEDSYVSSKASSPVIAHKHEQFDRTSKDKSEIDHSNIASEIKVGSWQNIDSKVGLTGSGEGGRSSTAPGGEHIMTTEDSRRLNECPSTNQLNSGKSLASSFSPMNALIESCARYSEANSSVSVDDDVGMNLLASVATGEMSRSDLISPAGSTERSTHAVDGGCNGDEAKSISSSEDYMEGVQTQFCNDTECNDKKQAALDGCSCSEDGLHLSKHEPLEFSGDKKCDQSHTSEGIPCGEGNNQLDSASTYSSSDADPKRDISIRSTEKKVPTSSSLPISADMVNDSESNHLIHEKANSTNVTDGINVMMTEMKTSTDLLSDDGKLTVEVAASNQFSEADCKEDVVEGLNMGTNSQQKLTSAIVKSEFAERANCEKLLQTARGQESVIEAAVEVEIGEPDEKDIKQCVTKSEKLNFNKEVDKNAAGRSHRAGLCSKSHQEEDYVEGKEILEHISVPVRVCLGSEDHEVQQKDELRESKSSSSQPDEEVECAAEDSSSSVAGASDLDPKIKFDLNEGFGVDEGKYEEPVRLMSSVATSVHMIKSSPFSVNSIPSSHSASITVAAAAKGPFVPPEDLMKSKGELRWKGSAATSAFRPAEPRKIYETPFCSTSMSCPDAATNKHGRLPLDFDLNVADERVLEEMASRDSALAIDSTTDIVNNHATLPDRSPGSKPVHGSGWLDLDLNRLDEANDDGHCSTSSNHKGEGSIVHAKLLDGLPTGDLRRDFDLNDGPGVDDASTEQLPFNQQIRGGTPSQLSSANLRMNNPGLGSFSSWFSPGNTYSTIAIPSMLPDRGEQPFPIFPPGAPQRTFGPSGVHPFSSNVYRGSVLSSSPAIPFPSSPFQFPVFPFGTTFPLPSATFPVGGTSYADSASGPRLFAPPVNSQLMGPVGAVASQFQRPYMVNLPDSSSVGGLEDNRRWGIQGLDLNAGPGAMENEAREEMLPLSSVQRSVASPQALAEEHARMYSVAGGILKRKEPEGGWEQESFRYKQSSRQ
ncbi:hypothetical protein ACJIZ3_009909 [Penstemon smallii]|uniref:Uncharacterized protein n=1 Tax=Penstemon smallii TaxID=265156 RepID=A0ABD3TG56_9LAMI